jgi:hypothetical protein
MARASTRLDGITAPGADELHLVVETKTLFFDAGD